MLYLQWLMLGDWYVVSSVAYVVGLVCCIFSGLCWGISMLYLQWLMLGDWYVVSSVAYVVGLVCCIFSGLCWGICLFYLANSEQLFCPIWNETLYKCLLLLHSSPTLNFGNAF